MTYYSVLISEKLYRTAKISKNPVNELINNRKDSLKSPRVSTADFGMAGGGRRWIPTKLLGFRAENFPRN
jgi:hypothetical protein